MRLLFLSPRECWPPNSGAKLRDFHFARALARGSELSYVYFGSAETAVPLAENLISAKAVLPVPPPVKYSPSKVIRGLVGRYPLPVQNYTSKDMERRIAEMITAAPFDIVHLDSIHLAAYLPQIRRLSPQARVILDWHNIESELMARFAQTTASPARRIYSQITAMQIRKLEQRMLPGCDGHLVCSGRELELLSHRDNGARLALASNGVDTSYFSPSHNAEVGKRLVFVGQMSYHANVEGITWFVREAWPAIRNRDPQFQLTIVGASPGPEVRSLASHPGVQVTGTVPDVRPFYAGAYAAIVPLLTAGGTRLKILEAMAAGTPVIATKLGAEGLPVTDRRDLLFADAPDSWLPAIEFLEHPERRRVLIENGRRLAVSQFDWTAIGERLLQLYQGWLRERR